MMPVEAKKLLMGSSVRPGQATFTTPGSFKWTCPPGVRKVSVVCVGGGGGLSGGGGGGLGWKNNIPVVPGQQYDVAVGASELGQAGGNSFFISLSVVAGRGAGVVGGTFVGDGGGNGGNGAGSNGGGGGAGGYAGNGGSANGGVGAGGGGAAGATRQGGGGVGLKGQGTSGATAGQGGSGGQDGTSTNGGLYGGGASGNTSAYQGGTGAVRIIWGLGRAFPSTKTGDV